MKSISKTKTQRGFTLVEIAIVLMIIGLLIGGILRGQELITSARVRNLIDQKSAIQTAHIAFMDRFRMVPGDLTAAQAAIIGNGAAGGWWGGDGMFLLNSGPNNSDSPVTFQNLTVTGFLACGVCTSIDIVPATINNSPVNVFGGIVRFGWALGGNAIAAPQTNTNQFWNVGGFLPDRVVLAQGANIESQLLAETDRKADDSFPLTGSYRYSAFDTNAGSAACFANNVAAGNVTLWANPTVANCEAAWLF